MKMIPDRLFPRKARSIILPGTLLLAPAVALATDPANWRVGPVYIAPTLEVEIRYVDNVLRQENDTFSSWILDTAPKVQAWLENGLNTYSLSYKLEDYRYADSSDDDFTDHQANLDIYHEFNARNRLEVMGEYFDGHEKRGTGLSEGRLALSIDDPVEVTRTRLGGLYTYGGGESRGRLQLGYKYYSPEYQNYRVFTQYRDFEQDLYLGTYYWRILPRTELLAEVRYTDVTYDETRPADAFGSLDSEEYTYFLGTRWEPTAKTAGSVRLGWYDREFKSDRRGKDDGFSWEVDVDYKIRSYSVLTLKTSRFSQETSGLGDFIDTQEYKLRWDHDWSSRSTTRLEVTRADDEFKSSGLLNRDDERWYGEARYTYKVRRWFDIGGGYRYEERDSNGFNLSYDRNAYFIEANLSL